MADVLNICDAIANIVMAIIAFLTAVIALWEYRRNNRDSLFSLLSYYQKQSNEQLSQLLLHNASLWGRAPDVMRQWKKCETEDIINQSCILLQTDIEKIKSSGCLMESYLDSIVQIFQERRTFPSILKSIQSEVEIVEKGRNEVIEALNSYTKSAFVLYFVVQGFLIDVDDWEMCVIQYSDIADEIPTFFNGVDMILESVPENQRNAINLSDRLSSYCISHLIYTLNKFEFTVFQMQKSI